MGAGVAGPTPQSVQSPQAASHVVKVKEETVEENKKRKREIDEERS